MCKLKLTGERELLCAFGVLISYLPGKLRAVTVFSHLWHLYLVFLSQTWGLHIIELFLKPYVFTILSPKTPWTCCNLETSDDLLYILCSHVIARHPGTRSSIYGFTRPPTSRVVITRNRRYLKMLSGVRKVTSLGFTKIRKYSINNWALVIF